LASKIQCNNHSQEIASNVQGYPPAGLVSGICACFDHRS